MAAETATARNIAPAAIRNANIDLVLFSRQGHDEADADVAGERSELFHTIHPVVARILQRPRAWARCPEIRWPTIHRSGPRPTGDFFVRSALGAVTAMG
jgi:hypothetical protein